MTASDRDPPALDRISAYDYALPPELIAQEPLADRSAARLLVVDRQAGSIAHRAVRELPELLRAGDALVLNDSRVVPARLHGRRTGTGGKWEGLFLGTTAYGLWRVIGQTRGYLRPGETITIPSPNAASTESLVLEFSGRETDGVWLLRPQSDVGPFALLEQFGTAPLPPYIRHGHEAAGDRERYQTVYATTPGSAAAPTAGLHFTPELLSECIARGIDAARVTLHVGLGTFRPVNVERLAEHVMHAEWCIATAGTMAALQQTRQRGGRIVAVGTTSLRTLETAVRANGWTGWEGESRLFVYPPFKFQAVDTLLTNFHLPKSTLLMLVSAFAGYDLIREAYRTAIAERYRFFSYGDAMLIV